MNHLAEHKLSKADISPVEISEIMPADILQRPARDIRVVVAMSGGVDSSVAAAIMQAKGYQVIGITLQLYNHSSDSTAPARKGACCAGQDIHDARNVAAHLGITHYVLDYENRFKQSVIDDFADSYVRGETPLPCVRCNQSVKFNDLLAETKRLGADALITGHYIRKQVHDGVASLYRAVQDKKDQSYFLFATTAAQLETLYFPLGGQDKAVTRQMAEDYRLPVAAKAESQDICFVPDGNYRTILEKLRPEAFVGGDIVDMAGNILGQHKGIAHYTIGQRKGIGIGGGMGDGGGAGDDTKPLYVLKLDAKHQRVIVGEKQALGNESILLGNCNWFTEDDALMQQSVTVKYRSVMKPIQARLERQGDKMRVHFTEPQYGIAPGQAAVCYDGDRVLGGGWIQRENCDNDFK